MKRVKSVLRGEFRISEDQELYQSVEKGFLHQMVLAVPKKFKPKDRVCVTIELLERDAARRKDKP